MLARYILIAGLLAVSGPTASAAEPASLELMGTIVLKGKPGKLDHLALDAKRERLFVANKVNNTLDVVDLKAGKLLQQLPNQFGVQGIAYAADLDRVYSALGTGGFCNIFDGSDYKLLKTIKFADDSDNVRYNAKTGRVYVNLEDKSEVAIVDAADAPGAMEALRAKYEQYRASAPPGPLIRLRPRRLLWWSARPS